MSWFRAIATLAIVAAMAAIGAPFQLLAGAVDDRRGSHWAVRLPLLWHRVASRLIRLTVEMRGAPAPTRPLLYVCNHVSWLDIIALGKALPACFVAKREVASWPFFGWLAKLQRTLFVERRRHATVAHRDHMQRRLEAGEQLILFAEGTSGDGLRVLPFKSAFFAVAERRIGGRPLTVQPLTIAYTRVHGLPITRAEMPLLAWYGNMQLAPHLWAMLTGPPVTAEIRLHAPVTLDRFGSRKALARHCEAAIARGLSDALAGRPARPRSGLDLDPASAAGVGEAAAQPVGADP